MARIFITGSADGLGRLAAKELVHQGHNVVLHARNTRRSQDALNAVPGAEQIFTGDLSNLEETLRLGEAVNASGTFDAVIHNAGVYQADSKTIFAVNTLAPYILTCLIEKPKRLIYLSSGMHLQGRTSFDEFNPTTTRVSYSDSKLHVVMLAKTIARKWPDVHSNALDPGWVPTKMGGQGAPDDLAKGYETQVWLATSDEPRANVTGRYFYHKKETRYNPAADDIENQQRLLKICETIAGVSFKG